MGRFELDLVFLPILSGRPLAFIIEAWRIYETRHLGKIENSETGAALFESLRQIWERLAAVQIGRVRMDDRIVEQMNPVEGDARMLLKAASASIDAAARKRLRLGL